MATYEYRVRDHWSRFDSAVRHAAMRAAKRMADKVVEEAIRRVPVDTGNLARSIQAEAQASVRGDKVQIKAGAYAPYAAAVEYGTASRGEPLGGVYGEPWPAVPPGKSTWTPYVIEPVTRKALRWEKPPGVEHFAKRVVHPGIKAQPYLRPAIDTMRTMHAKRILEEELRGGLGAALVEVFHTRETR